MSCALKKRAFGSATPLSLSSLSTLQPGPHTQPNERSLIIRGILYVRAELSPRHSVEKSGKFLDAHLFGQTIF